MVRTLVSFHSCLRWHDNPALLAACSDATVLFCVYCLDPRLMHPDRMGAVRLRFLLSSLVDLDQTLRQHGQRLFVLKGIPEETLPLLLDTWRIERMCYSYDHEPRGRARDEAIATATLQRGIRLSAHVCHTLYDLRQVVARARDNVPKTYQSFLKLCQTSLGAPRSPCANPPLPLPRLDTTAPLSNELVYDTIPTLQSLRPNETLTAELFPGGETTGLKRLNESLSDAHWVRQFEKPKTSPAALKPATTVLSPYLMLGCVSVALFYQKLDEIARSTPRGTSRSLPPVSLEGQILWREFFMLHGYATPHFDQMQGNPLCKQIPWRNEPELLAAWRDARTGYPWIDACMTQLRREGWLHHLARHSVACFLTRGDLFQHWEQGQRVFEQLLIDADWSLNAANWQWLSASSFFNQYFRVYSPVAFGRQWDAKGAFIRHYLPVLREMPDKYIYEPWTAPRSVQEAAHCIIGRDYPEPIVDHKLVMSRNMQWMKDAYASNR